MLALKTSSSAGRFQKKSLLLAGLALLLPWAGTGCKGQGGGEDKKDKKQADAPAPASLLARVPAALKKSGLAVQPFETAAARPYRAEGCSRGEVEELDVLVCSYRDARAAAAAEPDLLQFVAGAVTGAARHAGPLALVVVDRKKKDIKGQAINKVLKAFVTMPTGK